MKRKHVVAASSALMGAAGIAYSTAVHLFDSAAFDRTPKINSLGTGNHALTGIAKEGQDWLHAHDHDIRYMVNSKGMKLCAHYFPAENADRTLIEFHGWHGSWDVDFSGSSPFWHERGCNLLIVEERGQGDSDGDEMTFGIRERGDVMEWVRWYQKEINGRIPIYLTGVSMGAATLLMCAADDFPPQVRGMIADCGFSSAYEIIRLVGKKYFHIPEHPFMDTLNMYCRRKRGFDLKEGDVTYAMEHAKLPILFIHGKEDTFVPCWMTAESYEKCTSDKDILMVEGAAHGRSFLVDTESYIQKVMVFFSRHDKDAEDQDIITEE